MEFFPRDLTFKQITSSSTKYLLKETEKTNDDGDVGNTNNKQIVQTLLVFNSRPTIISTRAHSLSHFPNWVIFLDYKHARNLPRHDIENTKYIGLDVRTVRYLAL